MADKRIAVLISGRGSNLGALLEAQRAATLDGRIVLVISSKGDAPGLALARAQGVEAVTLDPRQHATRPAYDAALADTIRRCGPDLVVLAGFMRVLGERFVREFEGRLINIHPSLLPLYPGLHTHRRALADGVRLHGCTVHFVTQEVDVGPIIAQGAVAVHDDDDESSLAARVLAVEHALLPAAVRWFCAGRLVIAGNRVCVNGVSGAAHPPALLMPPA
jgi:phosphoribosylglycinamide formyltransferase-1